MSHPPELTDLWSRCAQGDEKFCRFARITERLAYFHNMLVTMILLGMWPPDIEKRGLPPIPIPRPPPPSPLEPAFEEIWSTLFILMEKDFLEIITKEAWIGEAKKVRDVLQKMIQSMDTRINELEERRNR